MSSRTRFRGYGAVTISLKPIGGIPGDVTADQMELVADLADAFSQGEARVSHEQNLVLPHVRSTIFRRSTTRSSRPVWAKAMSVSSPTSSPAPASTIARWRPRARSRSRKTFPNASAMGRAPAGSGR
jgi:hypothetical protein